MRLPQLGRRAARRVALGVGALLVLLLVSVVLVLYTGIGTRLAAWYLGWRLAPSMTIGAITGSLKGPLELIDLRFVGGRATVNADTIRLNWRLSRLFKRVLDITDLSAHGVEVLISDTAITSANVDSASAAVTSSLPEITLPVSIIAPSIAVERMGYRRTENEVVSTIDSILIGLVAGADTVVFQRLDVYSADARAEVLGSVRMSGMYSMSIEFEWRSAYRRFNGAGGGRLSGDLSRLELQHELTQPARVVMSASLDSALTAPTFSANLVAPDFDLQAIDSTLMDAMVAGEFHARGQLDAFRANADLRVASASIGTADSRVIISRREGLWYLDSLEVDFQDSPARVTGAGSLELRDGKPSFNALLRWSRLSWPLVGETRVTSNGRLRGVGTVDGYEINGTAGFDISGAGAGSLRLTTFGNRDSAVMSGSGEVFGGDLDVIAVLGISDSLDWSLELDARGVDLADMVPDPDGWLGREVSIAVGANGGRSGSGIYGDFTVTELSGELRDTPFRISGSGRLGPSYFAIKSARAMMLDGVVDANGMFSWHPNVEWQISAVAEDINPGSLLPDSNVWTGAVSATTWFDGARLPEGLSARISLDTMLGMLNGTDIMAKAKIRTIGDNYAVDTLSVIWGSLGLLAYGELGEQLSGRLELEAPDIGMALANSSGSLRAEIDVDGPRDEPALAVRFDAARLHYGEYEVGALVGGGTLDFSTGGRFDFSATGTDVELAGRAIDTAGVYVGGTSGNHTVSFTAVGGRNSTGISATGGISDWTWLGEVVDASVVDSLAGVWDLDLGVPLAVTKDSVILRDSACFSSDGAAACVAGSWRSNGHWSVDAEAQSIPLARFGFLLPPSIGANGNLNASASFYVAGNGALEGTGTVYSNSGTVSLALHQGVEALAYENGVASITVDSLGLRGSVELNARHEETRDSTYADLSGRFSLPGFHPLLDSVATQTLEGRVRVNLTDLSWLETMTPQLSGVSGHLESNFTLAGTVSDPRIVGEARLGGSADVPLLGMELRNVQFTAIGEGDGGIGLAGSLESGSGLLNVDGRVDMDSEAASVVRLTVAGTRFQAANTPEAQIWISPDLTIAAAGRQVSVSGEVVVPRADIELRHIPAIAVPVSRDAVLIGDTVAAGRPVIDISSQVRLVLGDSVSFRGFGLTGSPRGNLLAVDEPGQATTATGLLVVENGRYRAYGQDLTIETGRLIFGGGPIDNPGLDIRAVRRTRDSITAGLLVAGTLKTPELTVFSEPPMLQSEALAYLVLGRPISALSQSEGNQLHTAAASLGIRGGNMLAQRIAQRLGIDEARVETDGAWDEASFYAGKYLSPRLYVSYGIGLFDAASLFRIRYMLSQRWTLQAETGERTSTDINYRVERGR